MTERTRILVVNHDPAGLAATARLMRGKGFEVFEANTAEDASRLADAHHPAMVLSDVRPPDREEQLLDELDDIHRRFALMVAASLDGMWLWEIPAGHVDYSHRWEEMLGYPRDEIPPTLDFFNVIVHPDDRDAVWAAVDRHLADGTPYQIEYRLRTRSGAYRWFLARGQARWDADGRATEMAGAIQDITRRKQAEEDLRAALAEITELKERLEKENVYLKDEIKSTHDFDEIVGQSEAIRRVLHQVERVARADSNVLLLGETGTGKELLARAIHDRSSRRDQPLVKVNCAALPGSLIESELFGHVKGAFTSATADKVGRFQVADGGTLLLDEIGELDPDLQIKLLRVLQDGEFERIGSSETLRVDVRVIAATNRDLHEAMRDDLFRPDLYYRLAVFPIQVPPLRERPGDVPLLVRHFVKHKQRRLGKHIQSVPADVMQALLDYEWPGNVRELENVIERALILSPGSTLLLHEPLAHEVRPSASHPLSRNSSSRLADIDRLHILSVLRDCDWRIKGRGNAAERLGLNPSTLRYRMKKLGIEPPPRRPR